MKTIDDLLEADRLLAVSKAGEQIRQARKEVAYYDLYARSSELRAQAFEAEAAAMRTAPDWMTATNGDPESYDRFAASARDTAAGYVKLAEQARADLKSLRRTGYLS